MWAHQVIEDMDRQPPGWMTTETFRLSVEGTMKFLASSQKFHIGAIEKLASIMGNSIGKKLFFGELAIDCRLPYENSWFEWENYDKKTVPYGAKIGMWVTEIGMDALQVLSYTFDDELKMWLLCPLTSLVSIGKNIQDNKPLMEAISTMIIHGGARFPFDKVNVLPFWLTPIRNAYQDAIETTEIWLTLLNKTLMLLNCHNITTVPHLPPERLNRKRMRNGKTPLFTYHTLVIKPTAHAPTGSPLGIYHNRIHLCRGHFKTYTTDNPLFGRLTGRYWWQPHVRGQNKEGIVMKDYEVRGTP